MKPSDKYSQKMPQRPPVPRSDTSSVSEMLSASELEQLKRNGREQRAFAIQEFGLEE